MLPALPLLAPSPLAVEIDAPKIAAAGEPIHVVARLVNRSATPVVIVKPQVYGYELGLSFGGGLSQNGKPVPTTLGGIQAMQWMLPSQFGPELFQTLRPAESVEIENIVYRQAYKKPFTGLKRDLHTTPTADLSPGQYTVRFSYGFQPKFHLKRNERSGPKPELTPAGRSLYQKAWTGTTTASAKITIHPLPIGQNPSLSLR